MTDTTHLGLPFIEGSQAQKHVTHNEALRILDSVVQIGVLDTDRTTPPSSPAEGDRHIVASGATGAWTGHAKAVAVREDGAWRFLVPQLGWCAWSDADGVLLVYDGTAWTEVTSSGSMSGSVTLLGVNDTASAPNLLTVKSNAALFNAVAVADGGTGDMRLQISKEASAKTASVVFSDAFSGRAEFGLIGADDFKLKVSNDGTTFVEALTIDQSSGNATLTRGLALTGIISPPQITSNQNDYNPTGIASASVLNLSSDALRNVTGLASGAEGRVVVLLNTGSQPILLVNESGSSTAANRFSLGNDLGIAAKQAAILRYDGAASRWRAIARPCGRETLAASRTYYVRTDGSDSNDGLSNASGGAFLTIQKAITTVATLDLNGKSVTIQVASGTYTAGVSITSPFMGGVPLLQGDTTTPGNVVISVTGDAINVSNGAELSVGGFKLATATAGSGLNTSKAGRINVTGKMEFGACATAHMHSSYAGQIAVSADYTISGNALYHWWSETAGGSIAVIGRTVTLTGTPAFTAFANATIVAQIVAVSNTYSGAATGSRYSVTLNGVILSSGATLPGSTAGTTATGGQYN